VGDERDLDALQSAGVPLSGGEKSELVDGYRPGRCPGHHECEPLHSPPAKRAEQLGEPLPLVLATERERPRHRFDRLSPQRNQERAISDGAAGPGGHGSGARVDRGQGVPGVARADVSDDSIEPEPQDLGAAKRLRYQHRPVDELLGGAQELHVDKLPRKCRKAHRGLQPSDATSGNDDVQRAAPLARDIHGRSGQGLGCTTSTSQGELFTSRLETRPRTASGIIARPRDPMTIRSAPTSSAAWMIPATGSPRTTLVTAVTWSS
jgi:hypothetical protein